MTSRSTQSLILEKVEAIDSMLRDEGGVLVRLAVLESELHQLRGLLRWLWGAIGGLASGVVALALTEMQVFAQLFGGG